MTQQKIINQERIRKIEGSFSWIPHTFIRQGFWSSLNHHELLLYLFLVLVSDRQGFSYYSYDRICAMLKIHIDEYIQARNALIDMSLIAFDGYLFQVLSLPESVITDQPAQPPVVHIKSGMRRKDPKNVRQIFQEIFLDGKNNS